MVLQYHEVHRLFCSHLLSVPWHNLSFVPRAFCISAPKICNSLPPHILQSQTLSSFRRHLKTHHLPPSAHPQCALISSETLALYKSLIYLLTYLLTMVECSVVVQ